MANIELFIVHHIAFQLMNGAILKPSHIASKYIGTFVQHIQAECLISATVDNYFSLFVQVIIFVIS